MRELEGKVAVVTGGGSGIGAAIVRALAAEGMAVVAADIELAAAEAVVASLPTARAMAVDVADAVSLQALAARVADELGGCHLLCANAGVMVVGRLDERTEEDWAWILGVNLMGTIRTVQTFLPQLKAYPGDAQVVVTGSMAGFLAAGPGKGAYNTTKQALMGYCETLRVELEDEGVGVSLLIPDGTASRIMESGRNRPASLGESTVTPDDIALIVKGVGGAVQQPVPADEAVRSLVDGVRANAPWIVTHTTQRPLIEERFRQIGAAFDRAETLASQTDADD
jgi:NAD(P)-dependent dehydrogenase (short-subunit alcohol dehydrogenase family)